MASVAFFVKIISSFSLALIKFFTLNLVSSNLFVALTAKELMLLPMLENSFL